MQTRLERELGEFKEKYTRKIDRISGEDLISLAKAIVLAEGKRDEENINRSKELIDSFISYAATNSKVPYIQLAARLDELYTNPRLFPGTQAPDPRRVKQLLDQSLKTTYKANLLKKLSELSHQLRESKDIEQRSRCVKTLANVVENLVAIKNTSEESSPDSLEIAGKLAELRSLLVTEASIFLDADIFPLYAKKKSRDDFDKIQSARIAIAYIVQMLSKSGLPFDSLIESLSTSTVQVGETSRSGLDELFDIAIDHLSPDSQVQKEFLFQLHNALIARSGIGEAYKDLVHHRSFTAQITLANAILAHKDANKLGNVELLKLMGYFSKTEAMQIIEQNASLVKRKAELFQLLQTVDEKKEVGTIYHRLATEIDALASSEVDKKDSNEFRNQKVANIHRDAKSLFTKVIDSLNQDESATTALQAVLPIQQSFANLSILVGLLEKTVTRLAQPDLAEYVSMDDSKREARLLQAYYRWSDAPGARAAITGRIRRTRTSELDKAALLQGVQYMASVLLEIHGKEALSAIDKIIAIAEPNTVCEICETLSSRNAKIVFAKNYLLQHVPPAVDQPIDQDLVCRFVNALAQAHHAQVYEVLTTLRIWRGSEGSPPVIAEQYQSVALAILASEEMRQTLMNTESKVVYKIKLNSVIQAITNVDKITPATFQNWKKQEFDLVFKDPAEDIGWMRWGMLTNHDVVEQMSEHELIKQAKKLDLTKLTLEQIQQIDPKARIAIFKGWKTWSKVKNAIGDGVDIHHFRERINALTHDFTEAHIQQLAGCEAGLIASCKKKQLKKVVKVITTGDKKAEHRKMVWHLVQELNEGYLRPVDDRGSEVEYKLLHDAVNAKGNSVIGRSYRHRLMEVCLYQYKEGEGYKLEVNRFVKLEIQTSPNDFKNGASLDAFKVILADPSIIHLLRHYKMNSVGEEENKLGSYLNKAAQLGFSAQELDAFIKRLKETDADAANDLLKELPAFLQGTDKFGEDDVSAMLSLHRSYRDLVLDGFSYAEDPILRALNANPDQTGGKHKILGPIIFSNSHFFKEFVKQKKDYVPNDPWLIRQLKLITVGALLGAFTAGVLQFAKDVMHVINPANWLNPQGDRFARVALATVAGVLTGVGVGGALAAAMAPVILGAVVGVVAAVTLSTTWDVLAEGARSTWRGIRWLFGFSTRPEALDAIEIIEHGLKGLGDNKDQFLANLDTDPTLKEQLQRTLLYCYDHDYDIAERKDIPKEIRVAMTDLRDSYYYYTLHPIWCNALNVLATVTGGLFFTPPWYQKRRLDNLMSRVAKVAKAAIVEPRLEGGSPTLSSESSPELRLLAYPTTPVAARSDEPLNRPSPLARPTSLEGQDGGLQPKRRRPLRRA